ncbi:MAG: efflux RND transporter periplasmic adaptor subunit [Betaproteobacteria bacterium]|uniref:Efflux RND transporter periplasmic adaptor subunit n=1 Tax=Candidatus Proximibacter danicus TaxID=2954365 RepID=A0A9D7JYM8_9PROT|nr:efflux RND transporter periplasmic adaptor subunit [Candidatus Proximibacter danicus]
MSLPLSPLSKSKRFRVIALVAAGLIALAVYAYFANRTPSVASMPAGAAAPGGKPGAGGPPAGGFPMAVELVTVAPTSLSIDVSAVGSLRSNESVTLRPETAGRISSIGFKDGMAVAKGAVLVALDDAMQAAELAQARANLELARSTQKRNEDLHQRKFISGQALDSSAATLRVQEAAVALAQAKLAKTRIRAPFAGVVGIRNIGIGDYVKDGQELINLEDMQTLKVDFRLPEAMLARLSIGQAIEVTADAQPDEGFTATLDAINPLVDANGRSISCLARLDNAAGKLRPGMFVRARLILDARDNALMIPEQALVADPVQAFVFTVIEGKAKKVPVKTGLRRNAQLEIVEGLKAGDVVVTAGQLKLRDGAPVRNVDAAPPAIAPAGAAPTAPAPASPEAKPGLKPDTPAKAAS